MTPTRHAHPAAVGLRERKKAKTRTAIQQQAMKLFREQGYEATTIEQIAEAAEFSPSTFFRYFPTKEDVVMYDGLDPLMIEAFQAQPPELSPVQALRQATRAVFAQLSMEELRDMRQRAELFTAVPELRARMMSEMLRNIELVAELVGRRLGRRVDDFAVRTFAGAVIGVVMAAMLRTRDDPRTDFLASMDASLEQLEAGLPL